MQSETALDDAKRHDPAAFSRSIPHRPDSALPFDVAAAAPLPLILDTTVYIDRLQGKLPARIMALIAARAVFHSSVACAELAISAGILDPSHPSTARTVGTIHSALGTIGRDSLVEPTASAWVEGGVLAGILARTQGLAVPKKQLSNAEECCQRGRRRQLLHDALIYLSAVERNMLLVSGNTTDMDVILQVKPSANVLLYRREPS